MIKNIKELKELVQAFSTAHVTAVLQAIGQNAPWDLEMLLMFAAQELGGKEENGIKLLATGLSKQMLYIVDKNGVKYDDVNVPDSDWNHERAMVHISSKFRPTLDAFDMGVQGGGGEPSPVPTPTEPTPPMGPVIWD
jgi:hypothetical protein